MTRGKGKAPLQRKTGVRVRSHVMGNGSDGEKIEGALKSVRKMRQRKFSFNGANYRQTSIFTKALMLCLSEKKEFSITAGGSDCSDVFHVSDLDGSLAALNLHLQTSGDPDPHVVPHFGAPMADATVDVRKEVMDILLGCASYRRADFEAHVGQPIIPSVYRPGGVPIPPPFPLVGVAFHQTTMATVHCVSRLQDPGPGFPAISAIPSRNKICDLIIHYPHPHGWVTTISVHRS